MKLSSRLCAIFGIFPRSASPLQVPVQVTSKRKSIVGRGPFAVHDLLAGLAEPTSHVLRHRLGLGRLQDPLDPGGVGRLAQGPALLAQVLQVHTVP